MRTWIVVALLTLGVVLQSHATTAPGARLDVSTYELSPYIGSELPGYGPVYQIVARALGRSFMPAIDFFPPARARFNVSIKQHDIIFPVVQNANAGRDLLYSDPIVNLEVGLLYRKSSGLVDLDSLKPEHRIAVVRGDFSEQLKHRFAPASIEMVNRSTDAFRMLLAARVDFILIDKFTASEIMIDQFPYMIGKLQFIQSSISDIKLRVGFSVFNAHAKENLVLFNGNLHALRKEGVVDQVLYEHGLFVFPELKDKTLVRIATVENSDMKIMRAISKEFEKEHPGVKLEWQVLDESILRRRLLSDIAISHGQYDVMTIGAYEISHWAKRGWLAPLENISPAYHVDDLVDVVRTSLSQNGKLYSLPFYAESSMTYYRKDLFAKANIVMPPQPTWNEIRKFAERLHDPKKGVYGICLRSKVGWGENLALFGTMVNAFGGQWFDMNWNVTIDTHAWRKALTMYVDILQRFGPPQAFNNGYIENSQLFASGKCGMWIDATVAAGSLFDAKRSKVAGNVWFAPSPVGSVSNGSAWFWAWSLAVPSSSKVKPEAQQFIQWATSKQYITRVADDYGWVAVPPGTRKSTYQQADYQKAAPFAKFVLNAINSSNPEKPSAHQTPYSGIQLPNIPEYTAIGNFVSKQVNQALRGTISVDSALFNSQKFVDKVMHQSKEDDHRFDELIMKQLH